MEVIKTQPLYEAGATVGRSDDETLYALIVDLAQRSTVTVLGNQILRAAAHERWTVQRTALVLAFTFMVREESHMQELVDMADRMMRPIMMHMHCKTCTCVDKGISHED